MREDVRGLTLRRLRSLGCSWVTRMTEAKQRDRMIFLINKKYQDTKIGSFWPLAWSENHFIFLVRVWVSRGLVGRGGGVVAGVSLIEDVRGEFLILSGNDEWRLVPVLTSPQTESKHDVTITRLKLSTLTFSSFCTAQLEPREIWSLPCHRTLSQRDRPRRKSGCPRP